MSAAPVEPVPRPGVDDAALLSRAELRADVPVTLRLGAILVVAGLPLGAAWALLAPRVDTVTLAGGVGSAPLPGANDHAFDAVAVFALLVAAFGVVAGAVAWRRRTSRGPVMLLGAVLGALVGAWLAGRVGVWLALTPNPVPIMVDHAAASSANTPGPPLPATLGAPAASPGPWWLALVAGLTAAVAYLASAIVVGQEDMRRSSTNLERGSGIVTGTGPPA